MSLISNYLYFGDTPGITDIIQIIVDILNILVTAGVSHLGSQDVAEKTQQ